MLVNSSLSRSASCSALRKTLRTRLERPGVAPPCTRGSLLTSPSTELCQARGIDVHLAEHGRDDAVWLIDEREQQMLRQHLRMARALRELLCGQDGLLRFLGVAIQIHCVSSSFLSAS